MSKRETTLRFKGVVEQRREANQFLDSAGTAVLVQRGVLRSLVISCPDGCGEQLTINLDGRAGPAWRFYRKGDDISLFPSVWRETGCKSHFILWRSRIYWCDYNDELETPMEDVVAQVRAKLTPDLTSYVSIADGLGLVPWAVLSACHRLCRQGIAVRGTGKQQGQFRVSRGAKA
jgi:hypothetical protein